MNEWDEYLESEKRQKALEKRRATTTVSSDSEDDNDHPDPVNFNEISEKIITLKSNTENLTPEKRIRSKPVTPEIPETPKNQEICDSPAAEVPIISDWQIASNELPKNHLGVESGKISDQSISSPSFAKNGEPYKARLNAPTAWVSDIAVSSDFLEK